MTKHLVSFGCSWVWGEALEDKSLNTPSWDRAHKPYRDSHTFTGLLAEKYNLTYATYAESGSSIKSALWEFTRWIANTPKDELDESIVIVGLTEASRTSWFDSFDNKNKYMHSKLVQRGLLNNPNSDSWEAMFKMHLVLQDSDEFRESEYETLVRSFDGIAYRLGVPLLMVNVFGNNYSRTVETIKHIEPLIDIIRDDKSLVAFDGAHPNEKGHKIIADLLDKDIKEQINDRSNN